MCPGHERWHPNPGFYYLAGGGPMLDMGPYYITDLVNLLGPVASVSGVATRTRSERVITSEPLAGTRIPVEVATHVTGTLMFVSGAAVTMTMSFDVARHRHASDRTLWRERLAHRSRSELFRRQDRIRDRGGGLARDPDRRHAYADGNYRIIGVADMAQAIRSGRPHRASGELAFHVLEVMEAFQTSSDAGEAVDDLDPARAAGAIAAVARASANSTEEQIRTEERMREALIVWGGWSGHEPEKGAHIVAEMLEGHGFKVYIENTTEAFADPAIADMSLIVPIYTMSKIEKEEVENLTAAVERRRRPRRLSRRHVRRLPRQRRLSVHVRRPMGRPSRQHHRLPRRHHQARRSDHEGDLRASPTGPSNITCTSILRTKCWRRPRSPASTRPGPRAS